MSSNRPAAMSTSRTPSALKRDSLEAELERDPHLSSAKRQQRTQAFTSNMAHASLERRLVAAQTTKMELETKLREKDMLIEKLERDRRFFSEREQEEREEKERERAEYEEQTAKKDTELRTLRNSLTALREEFADLQDVHSSLQRSTSQTIASQKSQIITLTRQTTLLEEEISQVKLLAAERSQTIDEIQTQVHELSTASEHSLKAAEQESSDMAVVREELHRQAEYLRKLESTNTKLTSELAVLRARHTSIEVLREEKRGLELKLQPLEGLREKVVKLEAQVEAGRRERETWARNQQSENAASTSTPPVTVTQDLSALRLKHAQLMEDHGATVALLRSKEAELANAELRGAEAQESIEKLESDIALLNTKVSRCKQAAALAEGESQFMKALLASYSLEEATKEGASVDGARAEQVQQLEKLLEDYKTANARLMQQIDETVHREPVSVTEERKQELERERAANRETQQALDEALAESQAQLEKIEQLEQELFDLSGEIAGGRHVPPGVRVLSFKDTPELLLRDNPEARLSAMERVKEENAALIRRIEELTLRIGELQQGGAGGDNDTDTAITMRDATDTSNNDGGGSNNAGLIPRESWDAVCKERDVLRGEVTQKEKRLKRLQSVFSDKAEEFKQSIAVLLGVKLGFYASGQVRVTSLYDKDATFVFKPAKADGAGAGASSTGTTAMQLEALGEGGPQDLPDLMAYWVGSEQCIPGFLASVTLELYERWKKEQREGQGT
ncbi:mitotic checkpoint protein-domain-containing protein [Mycena sanguinolenta]|nr:mitotic checkpoint protein-domain-containing protein [Mycena sanguinolenta]